MDFGADAFGDGEDPGVIAPKKKVAPPARFAAKKPIDKNDEEMKVEDEVITKPSTSIVNNDDRPIPKSNKTNMMDE
jgi:hypothetical protein